MKEIVKPAISLCLQCGEWINIGIKANGWWTPKCRYWNPKKSTAECKYGPTKGCKYTLEYCLLDNRRNFKLYNGESYLPLVQYLYDNRDILSFMITGQMHKYDMGIYIYKGRIGEHSFNEVLEVINKILERNGKNLLLHKRKYDRIQLIRGSGLWESVQIEENIVRN